MKFNSPLPVSVPKECEKATKILLSFVDSRNDGLDGLVPRQILEQAHGFAIFTVVKAGFLFSARAGSGIVIARLPDGTWSAPSAIGSAGMGVGGQAGAEVTDFLIVLNTRAAVKSFMSAGSLTLGGNMSLAVGPVGRNGGAEVALNSKGKVAAMYSYSRTKGLFGGISLEGSIIVERQDANAIAYEADVTSKQLLSGVVPTPPWAQGLVRALERCTGLPTGQKWIQEDRTGSDVSGGYHFGGVGSSSSQSSPRGAMGILDRTRRMSGAFSPSWGRKKNATSYFPDSQDEFTEPPMAARSPFSDNRKSLSFSSKPADRLDGFDTHFESDFIPRQSAESNRLSRDPPRKSVEDYETRMRQNASPYSALGGPSPTQTQFADISAQQRLAISRENSFKSNTSSFFSRNKDKDKDAGSNGRPSSTYGGVGGWSAKFTRKDSDRKTKQFDLMTGDDDDNDPFNSSSYRDAPATTNGTGLGARQSFESGNGGPWSSNVASNGHGQNGNGRGFYPGLVETDLNMANKEANLWEDDPFSQKPARQPTPKISTKPGLREPQTEGVARAIALFDFVAQESGDLSFNKGDIITVVKKTNSMDDWWTGKVNGKQGIFPANFTEVV